MAAGSMSNRYVMDRFLPEKRLISLMRLLLPRDYSKNLQELRCKITTIRVEDESLGKETDVASKESKRRPEDSLDLFRDEAAELIVSGIRRNKSSGCKEAQREGSYSRAGELRYTPIPAIQA